MKKQIVRQIRRIIGAVLLIAVGLTLSALLRPEIQGLAVANLALPQVRLDSELLNETERVFSEIYNRVAPGVVSITSAARSGEQFFNVSGGTGFVIDTQGHIVTNFHVVDGADRLEISMFDGTIARAELVGTDPRL